MIKFLQLKANQGRTCILVYACCPSESPLLFFISPSNQLISIGYCHPFWSLVHHGNHGKRQEINLPTWSLMLRKDIICLNFIYKFWISAAHNDWSPWLILYWILEWTECTEFMCNLEKLLKIFFVLDTTSWGISYYYEGKGIQLYSTVCPMQLFVLNMTTSPYILNFCFYVIIWWNTIANFSVTRTIPKENIYVSILVQMLNRMNFGIGNYFFKLPRGGKVFFL
jgi:hypothetical protein